MRDDICMYYLNKSDFSMNDCFGDKGQLTIVLHTNAVQYRYVSL